MANAQTLDTAFLLPNQLLIIEDSEADISLIKLQLKKLDFTGEIVSCKSGQAALDYITTNRQNIKLIILDVLLPDMTAADVLTDIKKRAYNPHIPIIVHSQVRSEKMAHLCQSLHAVDYLVKSENVNTQLGIINILHTYWQKIA